MAKPKRESRNFGYARICEGDPDAKTQVAALRKHGILKRHIHVDEAKFNSTSKLYLLIEKMCEGDLIVVTSIDRLAIKDDYRNNYINSLSKMWDRIKATGADIRILDMPLLDTTLEIESTGTHTAELVSCIFSHLLQKEINERKEKHKQGMRTAKRKGKTIGRPKATFPTNWIDIYNKVKARIITATAVAEELDISRNTFYKLKREYESIIDKT
jgi:DNA invertase Pin-like site-specific DNA recombinase